ncbi:MAG: alpha/beta fold hydrolase [Flavobacteriales bacterium]|nr:alpha/beta fold hydrolase [Flavobacteriales bacterium]
MPNYILYLSIIVPSVVLSLGFALYYFQEKLIFHPEKLSSKFVFNFDSEFEELNYTTPDGNVLNALHFKVKNPKGLIFYLHGNAGNLDYWGNRAFDFLKLGYDVLMFDYRGFGKSTGSIRNEKMIYEDALLIYKIWTSKFTENQIVVFGISLGTGIATRLAHENNPKILILETPYFNFFDVSKFHYPYLPTSILLHYQFKNNKFLPEIHIPIYIFHGTEDETIPFNSSVRLSKLNKKISFFPIEHGSHSNLNSFELYQVKLNEILE